MKSSYREGCHGPAGAAKLTMPFADTRTNGWVSQGDEKILESYRWETVIVFYDLRGYNAFTETVEPEEVLDFVSPATASSYRSPTDRADEIAMREATGKLITRWHARGLPSTAALLLGRHLRSALATPAVAVPQAAQVASGLLSRPGKHPPG